MSDIKDRLAASLKYDAINGDERERAVVASQIKEAIAALAEKEREIIQLMSDAQRDANIISKFTTRIKELEGALEDAAKSLMTISDGAGKEMLTDIMQISGYANSRANAAKAAVTAQKEGV
jgi:hypothetical protein